MSKLSVQLRLLTGEDAEWMVEIDESASGAMAHAMNWNPEKLRAELDEGSWATEDRLAWAITTDGRPIGFALVTSIASGSAEVEMRIRGTERGQGYGRQVLGRLADHHFAEDRGLTRIGGRTHELNVPMQRAFVAAGFRMEARYRDSYEQTDGGRAAEWGYALTRADWESGRVSPPTDFDLHGRAFVLDAGDDAASGVVGAVVVKFLQEGRRLLAKYTGGPLQDGEAGGVLTDDSFVIRFVHDIDEGAQGFQRTTGQCRGRIQRLHDGRLELLMDLVSDAGQTMNLHLTERR